MNSKESFNLIKFYQQPNPLISHISILCIRLPTTLDREFSTLGHLLHIIHLGNFQESSGYSILLLLLLLLDSGLISDARTFNVQKHNV